MSLSPIVPTVASQDGAGPVSPQRRNRRNSSQPTPVHFSAQMAQTEATLHHAELFYLQKQIQSQTPMVIVLEDGEHVEGRIEWYDRNSLKVCGRNRTLIYKSAIKYMYKLGDVGQ